MRQRRVAATTGSIGVTSIAVAVGAAHHSLSHTCALQQHRTVVTVSVQHQLVIQPTVTPVTHHLVLHELHLELRHVAREVLGIDQQLLFHNLSASNAHAHAH